MNASSIRWSMAVSKLECGWPCCNLLDALARSKAQLSYSMPFLRQKAVPGWLQPPPLAAVYLVTVSHWLCFYLSTMYPFASCMRLLSCQACRSLPSISSPAPFLTAPHTHCVPGQLT